MADPNISRRQFLGYLGAAALATVSAGGCMESNTSQKTLQESTKAKDEKSLLDYALQYRTKYVEGTVESLNIEIYQETYRNIFGGEEPIGKPRNLLEIKLAENPNVFFDLDDPNSIETLVNNLDLKEGSKVKIGYYFDDNQGRISYTTIEKTD
jgi:hypothetical protein